MDIVNKQLQHQQALLSTAKEIAELLDKQNVVMELSRRQTGSKQEVLDSLLKRQQDAALARRLMNLHPADIAFVLDGLMHELRNHLWQLVSRKDRAAVLLELGDDTRKAVMEVIDEEELLDIAAMLDAAKLAVFVASLPEGRAARLLESLDQKDRHDVRETLGFPRDSVGSLMDTDMITVSEKLDVAMVLELLRKHRDKSGRVDQVYVTALDGRYSGSVLLTRLLFSSPETPVAEIVEKDRLTFFTDDPAGGAVSAFERYDLVSAPVLNIHNRIVGNIFVNRVIDYMEESRETRQLRQAGFSGREDIRTPSWKSARNRWSWLGLNLVTAFVASRIIGAFEHTLDQLIALATLMPIVASVGGNTGNQTLALMIRGMTLDQINTITVNSFLVREIKVSIINGLVWGLSVGIFAFIFYRDLMLSTILLASMVFCLLLAACAGILIPYTLESLGRDPVMGSNVLLTAVTDCMGFLVFLGLASVFLVA